MGSVLGLSVKCVTSLALVLTQECALGMHLHRKVSDQHWSTVIPGNVQAIGQAPLPLPTSPLLSNLPSQLETDAPDVDPGLVCGNGVSHRCDHTHWSFSFKPSPRLGRGSVWLNMYSVPGLSRAVQDCTSWPSCKIS